MLSTRIIQNRAKKRACNQHGDGASCCGRVLLHARRKLVSKQETRGAVQQDSGYLRTHRQATSLAASSGTGQVGKMGLSR